MDTSTFKSIVRIGLSAGLGLLLGCQSQTSKSQTDASASASQKLTRHEAQHQREIYWRFQEEPAKDSHSHSSDEKQAQWRLQLSLRCLRPLLRPDVPLTSIQLTFRAASGVRVIFDPELQAWVDSQKAGTLTPSPQECLQEIWAPPPWQTLRYELMVRQKPFPGSRSLPLPSSEKSRDIKVYQ